MQIDRHLLPSYSKAKSGVGNVVSTIATTLTTAVVIFVATAFFAAKWLGGKGWTNFFCNLDNFNLQWVRKCLMLIWCSLCNISSAPVDAPMAYQQTLFLVLMEHSTPTYDRAIINFNSLMHDSVSQKSHVVKCVGPMESKKRVKKCGPATQFSQFIYNGLVVYYFTNRKIWTNIFK